jgi:hypothetical protein
MRQGAESEGVRQPQADGEDRDAEEEEDGLREVRDGCRGQKGAQVQELYKEAREDGGEGNFERITKLASGKNLTKVEGTEDGLVGLFEDKDGREGYMVVNFTDPGKNIDNTITLNVTGGVHNAIVVLNGEKKTVPVKKGKIVLELKSGEGCFVIPY